MYKFTSVNQYTLADFQNNEIRCSHYEIFNDPFECWCIERNGFPDPKTEYDRFIDVISAWGFGKDQSEEALESYPELIESLSDSEFPIQPTLDSARISCFCKDADNLLMWAHYANGLRGFCVEFDENCFIEKSKQQIEIIPVTYQDSPPVMDTCVWTVAYDQVEFHEMLLDEPHSAAAEAEYSAYKQWLEESRKLLRQLYVNMLATKPKAWSYENEVRLIFHSLKPGKAADIFKYEDAAIKSIILGEKMSHEEKEILYALIQKKKIDVSVKIAKRDRVRYRVLLE